MDASNASSLAFRVLTCAASLCAASRSWFTKARRFAAATAMPEKRVPDIAEARCVRGKAFFRVVFPKFSPSDERGTCERFSCPREKPRANSVSGCPPLALARRRVGELLAPRTGSGHLSSRSSSRWLPSGARGGEAQPWGPRERCCCLGSSLGGDFSGAGPRTKTRRVVPPHTPTRRRALARMTRSRARRAIRAGTPSPPSPSTPGGATRAVPRDPDGTIEPRRRRPSLPRTTSRTTRLWTETAKAPSLRGTLIRALPVEGKTPERRTLRAD